MPTLDQFLDAFRKEVGPLIQKTAGDRAAEVRKTVEASLAKTREDLERWTTQLAAGEITLEAFEFLMRGEADLARMRALEEIGLTQVAVDRLRSGLIAGLIRVAGKVFL